MIPLVRPAGVLALAVALAAACGGTTLPSQSPIGSAAASASGAPSGIAAASTPAGGPSQGASPSIAPASADGSALPSASPGPLDFGNGNRRICVQRKPRQPRLLRGDRRAGHLGGLLRGAARRLVRADGLVLAARRRTHGHHLQGPERSAAHARRGRRLRPGGEWLYAPGTAARHVGVRRPERDTHRPRVGAGYAVYVDPGAFPSWSVTGTGLDQATFAGLAAALYHVQG